ncbi:peptidylprolyl isomerase [Arenibaculum sp.]|jgi:peptidyl-prolyl cis-trans isomerase C|uniref:peptidylprolyl isomerase n=1 Tax=Arenibaculum sp. TaxID=2865862 RepID=UPI002E105F6A|nr:peptidylprolyl isomerase [Arenibaculum sp.]
MKYASLIRVVALTVAFGGAASHAQAQNGTAAPADGEDRVLATVNGDEIRRSDVEGVLETLPPQVRSMPPQMIMPMVLDQVISGKVIAQQAYSQNLQDDPEVKEALARAEERIVQNLYLNREVERRLTPERIDEAYQAWRTENPPQPEVEARHILVASEEEARKVIERIKGGEDFAEVAREVSTDRAAAAQGGDLGYFTRDQMVEPFAEAAFAMEPGNLTEDPVQTQFGWHVIEVTGKREATPPALDEVRPELENSLREEIVMEVVDALRADADIERMDEAGTPAEAPAPQDGGEAPAQQ